MLTLCISFFCLFFSCVCNDCGRSKYPDAGELDLSPDAQIAGGIEARPHEFPWQVSLRYASENIHFCGGTIISESWVMTAAHCVRKIEDSSDFFAVVGEHDITTINDVRQNRYVEKFIIHEEYNFSTANNDIALIKVTPVIEFNVNVSAVCVPKPDELYVHQKSQISGWGRLAFGKSVSRVLMYTSLNITTNEFCQKRYPRETITGNMMCTSDNRNGYDRDACQGDSGGPLTVKDSNEVFSVVGIMSFGDGCASGYPGVYTRVTCFINWITEMITNE